MLDIRCRRAALCTAASQKLQDLQEIADAIWAMAETGSQMPDVFEDAKSTAYLEVVDHVRLGDKVSGCLENYNPVSKVRMDLALSQTEISKGYGMDE